MTGTPKIFKILILMSFCMAMSVAGSALTQKGGDMPLDKLVALSDDIVVGKVKSKTVNVVDRHFETDYEVEISETLKGKNYAPGKPMKMTVVGGNLTTPPLTQYVQGMPYMVQGETVALFVNRKPAKLQESARKRLGKSKLASTPRLVGMSQGKFSIITDEKTGKQKVTRFNLENYGLAPNDRALEKSLQAIETSKLRSVDAQILQETGNGKECDSPGCLSPHHGHPAKQSRNAKVNASGEEAAVQAEQGGPIPVQDLQQFKDQVRKFAK